MTSTAINGVSADRKAWQSRCRELASWAWDRLAIKRDRHGLYSADGSASWTFSALTKDDLAAHFAGEITLGAGEASSEDQCLWVGWDMDNHSGTSVSDSNLNYAIVMMNSLVDLGFRPIVEDSDGKGGVHVWVLFSNQVPCATAFRFAQWVVRDHKEHGVDKVELRPHAPTIQTGERCGLYLRIPGKHHKREHWSRFWGDGEWLEAAGGLEYLLSHKGDNPGLIPEIEPPPPSKPTVSTDWRSDDAVVERARKYVSRMPGAVSGSGGHNQTFHVACVAVKGFALSQDQAFDVLSEWNANCVPPWSEHELRHKIDDAAKTPGPTGYLRDAKPERWDSIPVPKYAQPANEAKQIDFEIIDSKTFAESDYRVNWAIEGVMAESQPQLYSGPSKTLKTSILADQVLSLAAAVPFLGRFNVPKAKRVLFLSSESGTATLQETANRICRTKGIALAELGDQLHWGFRPPQLKDSQHIATLTDFILKNRIEVLAIDPAYLSLSLEGNEAANQFAVGAVLMSLTTLQASTGCTPILATHTRMHMQAGVMPTLDHIAGAGFGQWARQWFLLNRREEFNPDEPGAHRLLFTFGGSAGHCGAYGLDIEEGRAADGRFWSVELNSLSQIREDKESEREARKRDQEQRNYENHRAAILRAIKRFPGGETKTRIKETASLSSQNFSGVFQDLLSSQEIEPCQFDRGELKADGTVRTYSGFRLVDPASRLKSDSRTLTDSHGLNPIQSG